MKLMVLAILGWRVFLMSGCNPSYTCGRMCYSYHGDSIILCQTTADPSTFNREVDSLNQLYGAGTAFLTDTLLVRGNSPGARNSVANQLKTQGYTCYDN